MENGVILGLLHKDYADLSINLVDKDRAYWVLYEGPIAGSYSPKSKFWGSLSDTLQTTTPNLLKGGGQNLDLQTVYFGEEAYDQVFYLHQQNKDTLADCLAYMGADKKGIKAKDGMMVFGFGRNDKPAPLFTQPEKFRIGL